MPTCNRFLMTLTLEQFFSAVLLRIFPIQNLEPSAVLSLRDVGCRFLLGNDALQVQFADSLKQGSPAAFDVLSIFQQRIRRACQQPPKLLCDLAIAQSANLFRHRSTCNRSLQAAPVLSFYPYRVRMVSRPSADTAFPACSLLKIKHLHTVGAAPMVTFGSGR